MDIIFNKEMRQLVWNRYKAVREYSKILAEQNTEFSNHFRRFTRGIPSTTMYRIVNIWYFEEVLEAFQNDNLEMAQKAYMKYRNYVDNIYYDRSPLYYIRSGRLLN